MLRDSMEVPMRPVLPLLSLSSTILFSFSCGGDPLACDANTPCTMAGYICALDTRTCVKGVGYGDIQGDMVQKGCTLSDCHGSPGSPDAMTSYIFDPSPGQEMAAYQVLINGMNMLGKFVDTTTPLKSQLLIQPQSQGHKGGVVFKTNADPTYLKWLSWIQKGAAYEPR